MLRQYMDDDDTESIRQLLERQFTRKKGPKKSFSYYISLVILYTKYKLQIEKIVEEIGRWGYPKDYLLILMAIKKIDTESSLSEYIYERMIKILKEDEEKYSRGERITTLAKWLPREKSGFDKKLGFVNKFCKKMYPEIKNTITSKKRYRQTISRLNKYIGPIEIQMCSKKYSKIDFSKISFCSLEQNYKTIVKEESVREKLKEYWLKKYTKKSFIGLINKGVCTTKELEKEVINMVWLKNRKYYINKVDNVIVNIRTKDVLLDMSRTIFNNQLPRAISIGIVAIMNDKNVIINAHSPYILDISKCSKDNLMSMIDVIKMECVDNEKINVNGARELIKKEVIVISDRKVEKKDDDGMDKILLRKRNIRRKGRWEKLNMMMRKENEYEWKMMTWILIIVMCWIYILL